MLANAGIGQPFVLSLQSLAVINWKDALKILSLEATGLLCLPFFRYIISLPRTVPHILYIYASHPFT